MANLSDNIISGTVPIKDLTKRTKKYALSVTEDDWTPDASTWGIAWADSDDNWFLDFYIKGTVSGHSSSSNLFPSDGGSGNFTIVGVTASSDTDWDFPATCSNVSTGGYCYLRVAASSTYMIVILPSGTNTNQTYEIEGTLALESEPTWAAANLENRVQITGVVEDNSAMVTSWTSYTPSPTNGFTGLTSVALEWRRIGENCEIRGSFAVSGTNGSDVEIPLPAGQTIGGLTTESVACGVMAKDADSTSRFSLTAKKGDTFFGVDQWTEASFSSNLTIPDPGSGITASGQVYTISNFSVPIAEWAGEGTVNVSASEVRSEVLVDTGNGFSTTGSNKIRRFSSLTTNVGDAITYADDAGTGASFTINKTGFYNITWIDSINVASARHIAVVKNSTDITASPENLAPEIVLAMNLLETAFVSNSVTTGSVRLEAGDVIVPQVDSTSNFVDSNDKVQFRISHVASPYGTTGIQSATSEQAGLLSYYKDGTFTPALTGTSSGSVNGSGTYTRIGKLVIAEIEFNSVNTTGFTGGVRITGLPYTVTSPSATVAAPWVINFNTDQTEADLKFYAVDGADYIDFISSGAGSLANWSSPGPGVYVRGTLVYRTDD